MGRALGDSPETIIALHLMRRGLCSAYAKGDPGYPDALAIQPTRPPEEPTAFGTDAWAIWCALAGLSGFE